MRIKNINPDNGNVAQPEAWLASSQAKDAKTLIGKLKAASTKLELFAQAFNPEAIAGGNHLSAAFLLAKNSFKNNENRANTLENEVLSKAAATTRIEEAIPKVGANSPKKFVLFTDAKGAKLSSLLKEIEATATKPKFKPNKKRLAKLFGITKEALENYSIEELVIEKMALSGIEK